MTETVQPGHYARKQLFSRSAIVAWSHRSRFRYARKIVEPYAGRRLLDYGCGDGTFLTEVCDLFPNATGGDIDSRQNDDCRKRFAAHPAISFLSIEELEQPAYRGVYDIVTCMEVLEHCLPQTTEKVIDDLRRLVTPDGTVVISVPIEIGPTLLGKQIIRTVSGWRSIGDYKFREKYTVAELATMLLADERTVIERPIYSGLDGTQPFHGHKGFNWRALRCRLQDAFEIRETRFSPLEFLCGYLSSQVWLVCMP